MDFGAAAFSVETVVQRDLQKGPIHIECDIQMKPIHVKIDYITENSYSAAALSIK